jgi:putative oxidoreductase
MATSMALILARLLVGWIFLASGYAALSDIAGTAGYFESLGVPAPMLAAWGTGIFEVVAGTMLAAGLGQRLVAPALAAFSIVASFLGHYGQGDGAMAFWHAQMFLKDIAIAGGLIGLAVAGAGRLSADAWLAARR